MIKIFIVEDEKPISDLLRMSLTKAGYECTCAYDGMDAADILENSRFAKRRIRAGCQKDG